MNARRDGLELDGELLLLMDEFRLVSWRRGLQMPNGATSAELQLSSAVTL